MFRRILNRHSLRTAMPFYLAMLLLVLSIAIVLAGGTLFYSLFRVAREQELDTRLRAIGQAAAPGIAQSAKFTMDFLLTNTDDLTTDWEVVFEDLARYEFRTNFATIAKRLRDLQRAADIESALLISTQGRVIADASGDLAPGTLAPHLQVDRFAWDPALKGQIDSTPYYKIQGVPHKRVYVPVRLPETKDGQAPVGAVLRLEASFGAARELERLRNQTLILGAVITALMATVALLLFRLIRAFARLTETAAHRDRLQAMGALTAGIAHEIRNPLGIIRALAEGLSGDFEEDDPAREMVDDIVGEVERLNRLVNQYLAFAKPDAGPGDRARPSELMHDLAHLLQRDDSSVAPVEVNASDDLPAVQMSEPALRQVLLNVLLNAREASPPERPIKLHAATIRGGHMVEILVRDHGPGIPSRDLRRVFEPFFTTRTQGSGLGLSICRSLVADCKGSIDLDSREGEGTTVRIVLPAAQGQD